MDITQVLLHDNIFHTVVRFFVQMEYLDLCVTSNLLLRIDIMMYDLCVI